MPSRDSKDELMGKISSFLISVYFLLQILAAEELKNSMFSTVAR